MNIQIQLTGNLTHDVELRYTPSGQAVAQVRLAHTPRRQDPQTQQWGDGEPTFLTGTVWGTAAEHAAESLQRGDRVIVIGTLRTEAFADRTTGEKRTVQRATIDEIGPSLRFATAKPQRSSRSGQSSQRYTAPPDDPTAAAVERLGGQVLEVVTGSPETAEDPWASQPGPGH